MNIENIIVMILSIFNLLYNIIVNFLILYVNDKYLKCFNKPINIKNSYIELLSDDSEQENEEELDNEDYKTIIKLTNIQKTFQRLQKTKKFNNDKSVIIKSFCFNLEKDKIVQNYQFTNKLILLINCYKVINTKLIIQLTKNNYKYIYILYKTESNIYKIQIVDLENNIELVNNIPTLFNIIRL